MTTSDVQTRNAVYFGVHSLDMGLDCLGSSQLLPADRGRLSLVLALPQPACQHDFLQFNTLSFAYRCMLGVVAEQIVLARRSVRHTYVICHGDAVSPSSHKMFREHSLFSHLHTQ